MCCQLELVILLECREGLSHVLSTTYSPEEEEWKCPYPEEWICKEVKQKPVGEVVPELGQPS